MKIMREVGIPPQNEAQRKNDTTDGFFPAGMHKSVKRIGACPLKTFVNRKP